MTDRTTTPPLTAQALARAAAAGLVGAAVSAERHPRALRGIGLVFAAGVGTATALATSGVLPRPKGETSSGPAGTGDGPPLPPAGAAALGGAVFVLAGATSEVGLRAQRAFERWADRTTGHPRVALGVATAALSLASELTDRSEAPAPR